METLFTREWLERKLAKSDDNDVTATSGASLDDFLSEVHHRTVTPLAIASAPTTIGKVVKFVREKKGWSISELAELANVDEKELLQLETAVQINLQPRTVILLAEVCDFSKDKFMELAHHKMPAVNESELRYAAHSRSTDAISDEDYDVVCALIETLQSKG